MKPQTFDDLVSDKPLILTQAERIVRRFGGVPRLVEILAQVGHPIHRCSVYKWLYPKDAGRDYAGGLIPQKNWPAIIMAAQADGIILTSEDFDPRKLPVKQ